MLELLFSSSGFLVTYILVV